MALKMEVLSAKIKTRTEFWNIRAMYDTGMLSQVTAEMRRYHLHILGVSESRRTGSGRYRTSTGDTVLYNWQEADKLAIYKHDRGVNYGLPRNNSS